MTIHRVVAQEWIVLEARLVPSPLYIFEGEGTTNGSE